MASVKNFRTSIAGFNKDDVVRYIEYINNKHSSELEQLKTQLKNAKDALAKADNTELKAKLEAAEARCAELEVFETRCAELEAQLAAGAPAPAAPAPGDELEAYRRAEAMERASSERVAKVNQQLNDLLDQVSGRYEQTGQEIQVLSEDIRINLKRLEETLSDLDAIFEDTNNGFQSLDTEDSFPISVE